MEGVKPSGWGQSFVDDGTFELTLTVRRDHMNAWRTSVHFPTGSCSTGISASNARWIEGKSSYSSRVLGTKGQVECSPDEPIPLLRVRSSQQPGKKGRPGMLFWIAPEN